MAFDADIIIAGGGLNGLTLALALDTAGFAVQIIDAAPKPQGLGDFDGRGYALALTAKRLLTTLNLWSELSEKAQPMLEIKVSDGKAGEGAAPFFMHFDHAEIEEGPMGFMVEDRHLRPALVAAVVARGIEYLSGQAITAQTPDPGGVTIELTDGTTKCARMLIGCDGKTGQTATGAGISRRTWEYEQAALVCAVEHSLPHNGIAHQFFMPSGPLAILPLASNRSSIVWTETKDEAARISALADADYLDALRPAFGDFLGKISLAGKRNTFPLSLSLADSFIADRMALVGDAARAVHPIAGQGLNAGLRDVAALTEVLFDARKRGEDFGSRQVLERYQSWRRFDTSTLALGTDTVNRLFSNDRPGLRILRDLGMGAVQAMPTLKRGLIREAAGLTGDLPRLMRGLPLN